MSELCNPCERAGNAAARDGLFMLPILRHTDCDGRCLKFYLVVFHSSTRIVVTRTNLGVAALFVWTTM